MSKPNSREYAKFNTSVTTRHAMCPDGVTVIDGTNSEGHVASLAECPGFSFWGGYLPEVICTPESDKDPFAFWLYNDLINCIPITISPGNGTSNGSSLSEIIKFRSTNKMLGSDIVRQALNNLWESTIKDASKKGRKEKGFWLFYNVKQGKYEIGKIKTGGLIKGYRDTHASVQPGGANPISNGVSPDAVPVAYAHTHTTLYYSSESCQREVGFSEKDINYEIAMILVDYIGIETENGYNIITNETDINAPYRYYTIDITDYNK